LKIAIIVYLALSLAAHVHTLVTTNYAEQLRADVLQPKLSIALTHLLGAFIGFLLAPVIYLYVGMQRGVWRLFSATPRRRS
jgi:hypothetical protein